MPDFVDVIFWWSVISFFVAMFVGRLIKTSSSSEDEYTSSYSDFRRVKK